MQSSYGANSTSSSTPSCPKTRTEPESSNPGGVLEICRDQPTRHWLCDSSYCQPSVDTPNPIRPRHAGLELVCVFGHDGHRHSAAVPIFLRRRSRSASGASAIKCCYAAAGSGTGAEETGLRAPVSRKTSIRDHKGIVVAKKMSRKVSRRVVRPACIAGVRISRPNFRAPCGRTKL